MADIFNMADTWNAPGTTFTAIKMNVTDMASAAASMLMDLQVGGSSRIRGRKDGMWQAQYLGLNSGTTNNVYMQASSSGVLQLFDGSGSFLSSLMFGNDLSISRDAADILALRRGANAQSFRWHHTFTDASNRQNGALKTAAGYIEVAAETAGTGADDLDVLLTPAGTGRVRFGTLTASSDVAITGYITIKDAGGTERKLAVIA